MKIEKIIAKNFQGLVEAEIPLGPYTIAFGKNGAGKSSLVDAILFALTGEAPRGATLPEVVRQGAKKLEVELIAEGHSIVRQRGRSGSGDVYFDGVSMKSAELDAHIAQLAGGSVQPLVASLSSGAILDLKAADLQALLARLTGAAFDSYRIEDALGERVLAAAKRLGINPPTTMAQFPAVWSTAKEEGKTAKRLVGEREGDIGRLPPIDAGVQAAATGITKAQAEATLRDARRRRDAANQARGAAAGRDEGANAERRRQVEERIAELENVPATSRPELASLRAAEQRVSSVDRELRDLEASILAGDRKVAELRKASEGSTDLPAGAQDAEELLEAAEADVKTAEHLVALAEADGKQKREQLDKATAAGHRCPTCTQAVPESVIADLQKQRDDAAKAYKEKAAELEQARTNAAQRRAAKKTCDEVRARIDAAAKAAQESAGLVGKRTRAKELEADRLQAAVDLKGLRDQEEAARKYESARVDIDNARVALKALAAPPAPAAPGPDAEALKELEREVAFAEQVLAAIDELARRADLKKQLRAAEQDRDDAELVTDACGPKGVRVGLMAKAVGPFLDAANRALEELKAGFQLEVDTDGELSFLVRGPNAALPPSRLSDGERARVLFALQLAVARLSKAPIVALDRIEFLDDEGRLLLKRLLAACAAEGIQVLMLSCAPPPAAMPAGLAGVHVVDGQASPIPVKEAA